MQPIYCDGETTMTGTINTIEDSADLFVLGESLRPLLTNEMGSSVEIFDTSGPAAAGRRRTSIRGRRPTSYSKASSK